MNTIRKSMLKATIPSFVWAVNDACRVGIASVCNFSCGVFTPFRTDQKIN